MQTVSDRGVLLILQHPGIHRRVCMASRAPRQDRVLVDMSMSAVFLRRYTHVESGLHTSREEPRTNSRFLPARLSRRTSRILPFRSPHLPKSMSRDSEYSSSFHGLRASSRRPVELSHLGYEGKIPAWTSRRHQSTQRPCRRLSSTRELGGQ